MQVSKWGNSLAIRIPSSVVEALDLAEGDEVLIRVAGDREFEVEKDETRAKALAHLRAMARDLPKDWKFDREEANAR